MVFDLISIGIILLAIGTVIAALKDFKTATFLAIITILTVVLFAI